MSIEHLVYGPAGALCYKKGDGRLIYEHHLPSIARNAMAYYTLESKEEGGVTYYRLRYDFWDIPVVYYSIWNMITGYHGKRTDSGAKANGVVRYSDWWTGGYYFPHNPPPSFVPADQSGTPPLHVQVFTNNYPPTSSSVWTLFCHSNASISMGPAGDTLGTRTGISPDGDYNKIYPNAQWDCPVSSVDLNL